VHVHMHAHARAHTHTHNSLILLISIVAFQVTGPHIFFSTFILHEIVDSSSYNSVCLNYKTTVLCNFFSWVVNSFCGMK
jgi:hypothetical protein